MVIVAPFAGAWIEMAMNTIEKPKKMSLPSRERGLKSATTGKNRKENESLPSRERGLKLSIVISLKCILCRSLRGSVD